LFSKGQSGQASLRYQIPLKPKKGFLHELSLGADYKFTNNFLQFETGEFVPPHVYVNIFQFEGSYKLDYETLSTNTTFEVELFGSPGRWIPHQETSAYESFRGGATPLYIYGRGAFSFLWQGWHHFSLYLSLRGQGTSTNLLPSEQFGLGGYDTVRGYEERILNLDNAFVSNFEVRSPLLKMSRGKSQLYFLGFVDYGVGVDHTSGGQEPAQGWLLGIGPGLRFNLDRFFTARLDWGIKLHQRAAFDDDSWNRVHFSLIGSF